jgi:hypothetical protein
MKEILDNIRNWNPIIQGALGSALFAFLLWFLRYIFLRITNISKKLRQEREIAELFRYYIDKYYVGSDGMFYFTQGFLLVLYKVLHKITLSLILVTSWYLINRIFDLYYIFDIFFGVSVIYILVSANEWFQPKLSKGDLTNYDPVVVNVVREKLLDERLKEREVKSTLKNKESEVEKLQNEIINLQKQLLGNKPKQKDK